MDIHTLRDVLEKLQNDPRGRVNATYAALKRLLYGLIEDAERRVDPTAAPQQGQAVRATGSIVIVRNGKGEVLFWRRGSDLTVEVWP